MVFGLVRHAATPVPMPPWSVRLPPEYQIEVIYPAPLACPDGIAITPSGNLLIGEDGTGNIKEVTVDGKVSTFATGLPASAVAINQQGEVFVGGYAGIWKLSSQAKPSKFSDLGVSKMAFGPDGYLYTINWQGSPPHPEIMNVSPQGKATVFFTGLSRPSSIAFSPSGELYVADPGSQRIVKVGSDGKMSTVVKDLWTDPIGIRFDKYGVLYFTSGWAGKVEYGLYKVSPTSDSICTITLSPPLTGTCQDMAIDDAGNIFLTSITYGMLHKVNPQGEVTILVEGWHNPMGMVVGPSGELFIADFSRFPLAPGRILKLDMQGKVTTFIEDLKHPVDLVFDISGNLFVSDLYGQILKITPQGEKQVFIGHPDPRSIAYDAVSGDLFVFMGNTKELFRITPKGNKSVVPIDFGEDVFDGRIAIDKQGNLFVCVVYTKNYGVGPTFSSLFKIATDGDVKTLAKFADQVPCCLVDIAISPSGDAFLLAHPLDGFEIRKVTPEGEVSIFASHLPVDPFSITFNGEGDLFFSCSTGIYRIYRTG
jgi:hypothetical protein